MFFAAQLDRTSALSLAKQLSRQLDWTPTTSWGALFTDMTTIVKILIKALTTMTRKIWV
jgi:hypothetical protein